MRKKLIFTIISILAVMVLGGASVGFTSEDKNNSYNFDRLNTDSNRLCFGV